MNQGFHQAGFEGVGGVRGTRLRRGGLRIGSGRRGRLLWAGQVSVALIQGRRRVMTRLQ